MSAHAAQDAPKDPDALTEGGPVLGVILAGGQNRRYGGRPKSFELVAGERIVDRAIRAMRSAAVKVVLVANDAATFEELGLPIRPDLRPGVGALGGIHTAVAWAREEGCRGALIAACDMPFLSAELLAALAKGARAEEAVAPASESRRGLEPLCAFYGVECLGPIEAAIDRGDRHVTSFFSEISLRTIPPQSVAQFGDPELLFLNVNTPDDRQRAESAMRRTEPST